MIHPIALSLRDRALDSAREIRAFQSRCTHVVNGRKRTDSIAWSSAEMIRLDALRLANAAEGLRFW